MERKYPCKAKIREWEAAKKVLKEFPEPEYVTVLTEAKYWDCCCGLRHAIEFPDGYPGPPNHCDYWMTEPEYLEFID